MKTRLFLALALIPIIMVPSFAKKIKTAECKGNILTDSRYGCQFEVPDNWKVKNFKENENQPQPLRALLMQKNYQINREAEDLGADFTIPELQIYVWPDTMSANSFLAKLSADIEGNSSDNEIINQLNLVLAGEFVGKNETVINGIPIIQAFYKRKWQRVMQGDPDDPKFRQHGGRIVRDVHDVHEVYIFKHDQDLYLIQAVVENEFYMMTRDEIAGIIASLKFVDK